MRTVAPTILVRSHASLVAVAGALAILAVLTSVLGAAFSRIARASQRTAWPASQGSVLAPIAAPAYPVTLGTGELLVIEAPTSPGLRLQVDYRAVVLAGERPHGQPQIVFGDIQAGDYYGLAGDDQGVWTLSKWLGGSGSERLAWIDLAQPSAEHTRIDVSVHAGQICVAWEGGGSIHYVDPEPAGIRSAGVRAGAAELQVLNLTVEGHDSVVAEGTTCGGG